MRANYIPCPNCFMNFSIINRIEPGFCKPIAKYPIEKIKFNKKYLAYANPVRTDTVNCIVQDFHLEAWEPIFLNSKGYLIDGQHRLAAAREMKLKFVDIVIIKS